MTLKTSFSIISICLVLCSCSVKKEKSTAALVNHIDNILGNEKESAKVLLLGTFHFRDAGLDKYKPKFPVDILSENRQQEIDEVLDVLEKFNPTKIIVERRPSYQAKLDNKYQSYLKGEYELPANEIYQIGFKLGKRLGHTSIIAGDQKARGIPYKKGDEIRYQEKLQNIIQSEGLKERLDIGFNEKFKKLYQFEDSLKTKVSLKDYYLYLNDKKRLDRYFGSYLVGDMGANNGEDYPHADALSFWWVNRNYRIFSHIRKEIESSNERVLVLFGAAHIGLIKPMVEASPEMNLVEFEDLTD